MTNAASVEENPGGFVPDARQDADLLRELGFIPGLKEILMLRQVHALEHATVWVLSEGAGSSDSVRIADNQLLGGMSTERGFYLYGDVATSDVQRAVHGALRRITTGGYDLAVHPRCGTNLSVLMLLTAGMGFGITMLLPKGPMGQLLGFGIAATAAAQLAPDLGAVAQRYVTTAIPFNLEIAQISAIQDFWGRPTHFVEVRWQES
ncbi:MAG: hypothetical protein GDA43_19515 [Hormoscilla sp. SP5CHS1]|nr:hypothetical protein [Hormoscilla sp. SP12CHS1]MBC6455121.1 hypothetical protein [Hormoscilla sp. SP5CHS1]